MNSSTSGPVQQPVQTSRSGLSVLFLIVFVDLIGFGIIIPLLPFLGLSFNASATMIIWAMGAYSLGQFIAAPVWGWLSDRYGRKPALLVSLAGGALGYVALGMAGSIWMVFAARLFSGLMAGNISVAFAYISDVTDDSNRARGMGLVGAAFGLGFILGPAMGGIIGGDDPGQPQFLAAALAAAGMTALALVGTILFLKESLTPADMQAARRAPHVSRRARLKRLMGRNVLLYFVILGFTSTLSFAMMESSFALWADARLGLTAFDIGMVFAGIGVVLALVQGVAIGPVTRMFGERRPLMVGLASYIIGFAGLALADSFWTCLLACIPIAIGGGLTNPTLNSLVSQQAEPGERGSIMGILQSAQSLARIISPAFAGPIFTGLGPTAPFWLAGVIMALVMPLALTACLQVRRNLEQGTP